MSMPSLPNWLSIGVTGIGTVVPLLMPIIPPPYQTGVAGVIAMLGALWHLYTPNPKPASTLK